MMNTTTFFKTLSDHFNEIDQKIFIEAINQDQLIQKHLMNPDFFQQCVEAFGNNLSNWSLGKVACLSLGIKPELLQKDVNEKFYLKKSIAIFDNNLKDLNADLDFEKATHIALALFERKRKNQSWNGVIQELSNRQPRKKILPNWRTSLAILYSLLNYDENFLIALIDDNDPYLGMSFNNHILSAQFLSRKEKANSIVNLVEKLTVENQIAFLQSIPSQIPYLMNDITESISTSTVLNSGLFQNLEFQEEGHFALFDPTYKLNLLNGFIHQIGASPIQSQSNFKFAKEKIKKILRFIDLNIDDGSKEIENGYHEIYRNEPFFEDLFLSPPSKVENSTANNQNFAKGIISILELACETQEKGESTKAREMATNQFKVWLEKINASWPNPEIITYLSKLAHKKIIKSLNFLGLHGLSAEYVVYLHSLPVTNTVSNQEFIDALVVLGKYDEAYQELKSSLLINGNDSGLYKRIFSVLENSENWKSLFTEWVTYANQFKMTHDDWIRYANAALNSNNFEETQTILNQMKEDGVDQLQIDILQGKLFYKLGDYENAKLILEKATKQIPNFADGWLVLSEVLVEMGHIEKSIETLRTAVLAIPDSDEINFCLAKIYFHQELFAESLPYIRKANALNSNQAVYAKHLIQTLQILGRLDEADTILNQARLKWTNEPEIAYLDAIRQIEKQHRELALAAFDVAINSNVANVPVERIKLYVQTILGDQPEKFLPTDGKYNTINNLLSAQKYLQSIINEENEDNQYLHLLLGEIYYLTGEYEAANSQYSKLINEFKDSDQLKNYLWRAYAGFGLVKIGLKETDSGIAALEEADQLNAQHLGIKQQCAEAYLTANLINKAENKADEIYDLGSTRIDNLIWYTEFMKTIGKQENEVKSLEQILHFEPTNPYAITQLSGIYIANGKIEEAFELLNRLENAVDLNEDHIKSAVISLLRIKKNEEALNLFLKIPDGTHGTQSNLRRFEKIYLLLCNEIWSKALFETQQLKSNGLNNLIISAMEGFTLFNLGDYAASVSAYETALILPKDNSEYSLSELAQKTIIPEAWLNKLTDELEIYSFLTKSYNSLNDFDHSLEVINRMVRVNPNNLWNYIWGAENAIQLTDYDLAADYLLRLKNIAKEGDWQDTEDYAAALEFSCAFLDGREYKLSFKESEDTSIIRKILIAHQLLDSKKFADAQNLYEEIFVTKSESTNNIFDQSDLNFAEIKQVIKDRLLVLLSWRFYDFKSLEKMLDYSKGRLSKFSTVEEIYLRLSVNMSYKHLSKLLEMAEISEHRSEIINSEAMDKMTNNNYFDRIVNFSQTKALRNIVSLKKAIEENDISIETGLLNSNNLPDYLKYVIIDVLMKENQKSKVEEYINNHQSKPLPLAFYLINEPNQSSDVVLGIINSSTSDDPIWLFLCSSIFEKHRKLDEAIELGELAFNIWPDENNWLVRLAKLNQNAGYLDKAEAYWMEIIQREHNPEKHIYHFANLLMENNKAKETLELLEEYKHKIPDSINLHITKGTALIKGKSIEQLRTEIQLARNFGQKSLDIEFLEANAKYLEGKNEQALIKLQEILMEEPKFSKAHILNAKILREGGKYHDAIKEINKSLQVCPENKSLIIEKAMNLRAINEMSDGLLLASELSQKYPGDTNILNLLADFYNEIEDFHAAEKVARKSLMIDANQSELHKLLGRLAKNQGHLDKALDHFSKAVLIDELDVQAWVEMGDIHLDQNESEKALNAYREACSRNQKEPLPYYKSGLLLRDLKDYEAAEKMLRIASDLSPKDATIRRQLAGVIALNLVHSA